MDRRIKKHILLSEQLLINKIMKMNVPISKIGPIGNYRQNAENYKIHRPHGGHLFLFI